MGILAPRPLCCIVPPMNSNDPSSLSRREALKIIGTTAAVTGLGMHRLVAAETTPAALGWDLPALPYAYAALEPHFDARTMEIHHTKHHQAYITNAKNLLKDHPDLLARGPEALVRDLTAVPEAIRTGIRNNAGGHVNHTFFWQILAPDQKASTGQLPVALAAAFGSMDDFKKQFADAAMKRFGSGWAWLVVKGGKLQITSTANQDSPISDGATPIIGLDVWEHAYYLHYQNRRTDYVTAFWNVLNWAQAEANYNRALKA
jgi:superoxide dismutase, Fe-Mn family